jgi:uncharacterized protein (TIGR03083 family)
VGLSRQQVVAGLLAEYEVFASLVEPLDVTEWNTATRCVGWLTRDVAAHVLGNAIDTATGAIGSRSPDEQARALRVRDPMSLAAELRRTAARLSPTLFRLDAARWTAPVPLHDYTVGEGILTLWYDAVVHGDDIRAALGHPPTRGPGLIAALECVVQRLQQRGWGPAHLTLDGIDEFSIGTGGPVLRGDPWQFLLVATGRADPRTLGLDDRVCIYRPPGDTEITGAGDGRPDGSIDSPDLRQRP